MVHSRAVTGILFQGFGAEYKKGILFTPWYDGKTS